MRITVVGWGNVGRTLGSGWAGAGHSVVIATRDPDSQAAEGWRAEGWNVGGVQSAADSDVVVLAMPGAAVVEVATNNAAALNGRLVIDTTNALGSDGALNRLAELSQALPDARLVRAFTTMAWENFAEPNIGGRTLDQYYVGEPAPGSADDECVAELIADLGLRPVRLGGLDQVVHLDALTKVWFHLVWQLGYPRRTALTITTTSSGDHRGAGR
jgi:predicted dinucleotide-binding enzyme